MANIIKFGGNAVAGDGGNAVAGDLLVGKTASVDAGEIVGTMPNMSNSWGVSPVVYSDPGIIYLYPPKGFYDGSRGVGFPGGVNYSDPDFIAANIKKNVNIFGLVGTYDPKFPSKVKFVQPGAAGTYIYDFGVSVIAALVRFLGSGGTNASYDCKVEGSNDGTNYVQLYNANLNGWGSQNYAYANLVGAYRWYRVTVTVVATSTYNAHCFVLIPNGSVELG